MKRSYFIHLLLTITFISFPTILFADNVIHEKVTTEFFLSNNTNVIDLQTAFNRLMGDEQVKLENTSITVLQKEHMQQSKFEDILGTYKMANSQNTTADNSEKVITSAYQWLPSLKTFKIAVELANVLKQESVAVFIPSKEPIVGDTILKLKSHSYTINEIIETIHVKLPEQYSQAFSLHLKKMINADFNNSIVDQVEWLGSAVNSDEIKKAFPLETVVSYYGKAYLVYKNGQREQL